MIASHPEIGFTGTQRGTTEPQLDTVRIWLERFRERGVIWKNNGDCIGADAETGLLWVFLGGKLRLHIPASDAKRAFLTGHASEPPLPYLTRNRNIVDRSGALIATPGEFTEQVRSGTWSTVRYARRRSPPTLIVFPDGTCAKENWRRP